MKYAGWVFVLLLVSPTLCASDVTVGSSFKILDVVRGENKISLPLAREKCANIRVLNRATYQRLLRCTDPCILLAESLNPVVAQIRPARTQENMWIAEVDYLPSWRMTFLVFKKGKDFSIKYPEHVEFLDENLKWSTQEIILQTLEESK